MADSMRRARVFQLLDNNKPLELLPWQSHVDENSRRFTVVEAGRRTGKTKWLLQRACKRAARPRTLHWYIAPTYNQAKEIAWHELLRMLPAPLIRRKHETTLVIELINDSTIALKGSDNPDSLRGRKLDSAGVEEAAYQKEYIWTDILRATLADSQGEADFISTPKGRNWFHKLYELGRSGRDPLWTGFHYTIYDNPHITREEIAQIKASVSDLVWRQEYLAEVLANVGLVYDEFDERDNVYASDRLIIPMEWPMVRAIDWGMDDDTGVTWSQLAPNGVTYFTHEHSQSNWSVPRHAELIHRFNGRRQVRKGLTVLSHDAFKEDSNISIAKQFAGQGISCISSSRNPDVGIELMKRALAGDRARGGLPWMRVSDRCPKMIEAFKTWEWDQHEPDILQSARYNLTLIWQRRLSALLRGINLTPLIMADNSSPEPEERNPLTRRRKRDVSFTFDEDYGVPS